jgi:hypothetical protein
MTTSSKNRLVASAVVLLALVGGVIVGATAFKDKQSPAPTPSVSPTPTPTPSVSTVPAATVSQAEENTSATIQGRNIFPAEGIPKDFKVCAVNTATQQQICTDTGGSSHYSLQVPAGSYQVYAVVPSLDPNKRAYYSEFVKCGLDVSCPSHAPITFTVQPGKTITGIDAGDFYTP